MESGFTRKKVESLTLGEKLRKLRSDFRMSLVDVSKATRIQVKYLELLESGEYEKLPADVYVRGFLRSYARYLNVDEQTLVRLYERERHIQENLDRENTRNTKHVTHSFTPTSIVITSRSVAVAVIALLVAGAFFYLYQEFKSFAADPELVILEPQYGATIESNEVVVQGKTDKGSQVSLNNQTIFVDGEGLFSDKLFLQPGINIVQVRTVNRFEKEKVATFSVDARYTPVVPATTSDQEVQAVTKEAFSLEVVARTLPLMLQVMADGAVVFSGKLAVGETKTFSANEQVSITTDHGEATLVRMNATGEEEALSSTDGPVKDVVFLWSGKQPE